MLRFSDIRVRPVRWCVLALAVCAVLLCTTRPADCPRAEITMDNLTLEEDRVALIHAIHDDEKYLDEWLNQKLLFVQDVVTGQEVTEAEAEMNQATQKLELSVITMAKTYLSFLQDAIHIEVVDASQSVDEQKNRYMQMTVKNTSEKEMAETAFDTLESGYEALEDYIVARKQKFVDYNRNLQKILTDYTTGGVEDREEKIIQHLKAEMEEAQRSIDSAAFALRMRANKITRSQIDDSLSIKNIYVSVTVGNVAVTDPFEVRIPLLSHNQSKTLDFELNKAVEDVTLNLQYKVQDTEMKLTSNVKLKKRQENDFIEVESRAFSQEGVLGSWVNFDISLIRQAETDKTVRLDVVNLPAEFVDYQFTEGGNTVPLVKFAKDNNEHSLTLKVRVPDTLSDELLGKGIPFYALVGEERAIRAIKMDYEETGELDEADIAAYKDVYSVELHLKCRGTGDMEMSFTNLYHEIFLGAKLKESFEIENTGTVDLKDIRYKTEAPGKFEIEFKPDKIQTLAPRQKQKVEIMVTPPPGVEVGKYEVKVWAECDHEGSTVETGKKTMSIKINAKPNPGRTYMLVGVLLLVIVIVAVFTIKLSRR